MTALALARRAFWSRHPLCELYAIAHGRWVGGTFVPADRWSLRDLIRFAEALPPAAIANLSENQPC